MLELFDLIRDVADSNASVLIQGESGTGKELVAAAGLAGGGARAPGKITSTALPRVFFGPLREAALKRAW